MNGIDKLLYMVNVFGVRRVQCWLAGDDTVIPRWAFDKAMAQYGALQGGVKVVPLAEGEYPFEREQRMMLATMLGVGVTQEG